MNYYDRIYGQIQLDSVLGDIIRLCPEIKRLKYVGMMNYRSLEMLGLTSISRLEHVIGTAYLAQIFAYSNDIKCKNELLVASIYHDVNCAPFGHAVEWAINRYTSFKHEEQVDWMIDASDKANLSMPNFYGENGLHRYKFKDQFLLDMVLVTKFIQGKDSFVINNSGIDLDNIDNVYRMGACLGLVGDQISYPVLLAQNLRQLRGLNNFVIKDKMIHLVEHWHDLRTSVYNKFIYSKEYFAYEGLLFKLLAEYVKDREADDLAALWSHTDDLFITSLINHDNHEIRKIVKKLILFDFDVVSFLIKTDDYATADLINNDAYISDLIYLAVEKYNDSTKSKLLPSDFYLHVTTDNKKTARKVKIYLEDSRGNISEESIGYDKQSLVAGFIGKVQLQKPPVMIAIICDILKTRGLGNWSFIPFADEVSGSYEQFGLF